MSLMVDDVHGTRSFRCNFLSALSEEISTIVICSPYFDKLPKPFDDVIGFCKFLQRRSNPKIQIITGPPSRGSASLPASDASALSRQNVEIYIRTKPYLHAKLYHVEYVKGHFRSFVGSANFTNGGLERNDEVIVEMMGVGDGSQVHREIARLQNMGSVSYEEWLVRNHPEDEMEVQ